MPRVERSERLRYRFDRSMSRGLRSSMGVVLAVFATAFLLLTLLRLFLTQVVGVGPVERGDNWATQVWITFLEITDPGSMTQDVDSGVGIKLLAALVGMAGLVIVSVQIAVVTTAIDGRLGRLRRGRSRVISEGHTVILGWNDRITDVVSELILATDGPGTVVVLADRDKEEMDEFFFEELEGFGGTDIVTRRGNPASVSDLRIARTSTCRSVIVLADCNVSASPGLRRESDINAIKRILAVFAASPVDFVAPVVVEVFGAVERSIVEELAPGQVIGVNSDEVISRLLVQTSRNIGLASMYEAMLSFEGAELEILMGLPDVPTLTFEELSYFLESGIAVGAVWKETGAITLNPDPQTPLRRLGGLVILTDGTRPARFRYSQLATPARMPASRNLPAPVEEHVLIIGWTTKTATVCREFDGYLAKGSSIDVMTERSSPANEVIRRLNNELENVDVACITGDPTRREDLEALVPMEYHQVMLLSGGHRGDSTDTIDAETIISVLLLRKIYADVGASADNLTTEILDSTNRRLVSHINRTDHIVSNRLVSGLLTRLSENPERRPVYLELFRAEGSEFYVKPIDLYLDPIRWVRFVDLMRLAARRGEVAVGLQLPPSESDPNGRREVQLVPDKTVFLPITEHHSLVVMARHQY